MNQLALEHKLWHHYHATVSQDSEYRRQYKMLVQQAQSGPVNRFVLEQTMALLALRDCPEALHKLATETVLLSIRLGFWAHDMSGAKITGARVL